MSTSLYARLNARFGRPVTLQERRDFLKLSLAAGAGALMSMSGAARAWNRPALAAKRVVVVGGGFSGLACAYELLSAGYDVTVVEAKDWAGGRVHSFNAASKKEYIPGRNIEGGAELIGSNHPLWVAYKEKFGLEFLDVSENEEWETPIVLGGKRLTTEETEKVWEELDAACTAMNADASPILEDEPWKSPNATALDQRSLADWLTKTEMSDLTRKALSAQFAGDNGVANEKASYLGMLAAVKGGGVEKYWTESEVFRCKGGNQQLAFKFAEALGKKLILGLPVSGIQVKGEKVVVTCRDARTIECDDVVLATSPAVWSKIEIKPGLPREISPQMGVNVKYLAEVKKRYWEEGKLNAMALTDGDVTWAWDATDGQEGADHIGLSSFSGGPAAERARARKGKARDDAYKAELDVALPGFGENFTQARFMDWPSDPWTMAGYSFPAPGQVTGVGPLLAAGHGKNLHFAGEHCCYKFVGYMEGALCAGASVAKRLAKRDGVAK